MRSRSMRAPIAILAILGLLVAITAVPAAAQSSTPTCAAVGESTGEAAEGATLTYDSSFVCSDAADAGTWAITVVVANHAESTTGVTLTDVTLAHTSPRPNNVGPEADVASHSLPLELAADESGAFDADGSFELAAVDEGGKAILHLWVEAATDEGEPFRLAINVQVLGPGVAPDDEDDLSGDVDGEADGRPEWVPGPPQWVIEMLRTLFANGFPWGTDDFPPGPGADDGEEGAAEAEIDAGPPSWVPGPPPWAPVPPNAGSGDSDNGEEDEDDGPPSWVPGPPAEIPGPPAGRP